VAEANGRDERI